MREHYTGKRQVMYFDTIRQSWYEVDMTTIHISSKLANKLNQLATRKHKTIDEVLERLLETEIIEEATTIEDDAPGGTALLKAIRAGNHLWRF